MTVKKWSFYLFFESIEFVKKIYQNSRPKRGTLIIHKMLEEIGEVNISDFSLKSTRSAIQICRLLKKKHQNQVYDKMASKRPEEKNAIEI